MSFSLADEFLSTGETVIKVFAEQKIDVLNAKIETYLESVDHQLLEVRYSSSSNNYSEVLLVMRRR